MEEIWKDIEKYEGLYQVSNLGRVKSLPVHREVGWADYVSKEKILKQCKDKYGYLSVCLHKGDTQRVVRVHRLVALAFIANTNNYRCINHKDEDKSNNHVHNLEWCTHSYNNRYGARSDKVREKTGKRVLQYALDGTFIKEWVCMRVAQRELGVRQIDAVCRGERKTAGGYTWKYKDRV